MKKFILISMIVVIITSFSACENTRGYNVDTDAHLIYVNK